MKRICLLLICLTVILLTFRKNSDATPETLISINHNVEKAVGFRHKLTGYKISILDSVLLTNNSKEDLTLQYFDNYDEVILVMVPAHGQNIIYTSSSIFLRRISKYENFYIINPGDIINIVVDSEGSAILQVKGNQRRNNELDFPGN